MTQIELIMAAGLVSLLLAVSSFFYGQHVGKAEAAAGNFKNQVAYNAGQTDAARDIADHQITYDQLKNALHEQLAADHVYADCHNTAVGLRALDDARHDRPVSPDSGLVPGRAARGKR